MQCPAPPRFVSYLRVSTARQGRSGLGLDAQREACRAYLATVPGAVCVQEFVEQESGSRDDRPELAAAIAQADAYGATLLIAKLDRLSRNAHFLIGLKQAGVEFVACDNPQANRLTIGILALVAEQEREAISERTKAALAIARERLAANGQRLGNPNGASHLKGRGNSEATAKVRADADKFAKRIGPILAKLREEGFTSASGIARELNNRGIPSARNGVWTARTIINLQSRS